MTNEAEKMPSVDECPPTLWVDKVGTGTWVSHPERGWELPYIRSDIPREQVAQFMLKHSIATGHGDTIEDLLMELGGHIERREAEISRLKEAVRELGKFVKNCSEQVTHNENWRMGRAEHAPNTYDDCQDEIIEATRRDAIPLWEKHAQTIKECGVE